jgi:hypothetical protein
MKMQSSARRLALLVALLLLALPAVANASLALILCSRDRCVAVSDSRAWFKDIVTGKRFDSHDDAIKIDIRDGYMFATTGVISGPGWPDAWAAWRAVTSRPGESAQQRLDRVTAAIQAQRTNVPAPTRLTVAVFRFCGATADGASVELDNAGRAPAKVVEPRVLHEVPYVQAFSPWGGIDNEPKMGTLLRALYNLLLTNPAEAQLVAAARAVVLDVETWEPAVGGPVHAAVCDSAGCRWIAR